MSWQQGEGSRQAASGQPPAGWYPDPQYPGRVRYWDGADWTDHSQPAQLQHHPMPGGHVAGSLRNRARALKVLFSVLLVMTVAMLLSSFALRGVLARMVEELGTVSESDYTTATLRQAGIAVVQVPVYLAVVVMFLVWFYRAYQDPALNRGMLRFSPGWAIGAWFVPILSLFRPKQMMDDVWRASGRTRPADSPEGRPRVPALLNAWWALFLLSGYVGLAGLRMAGLNPETVQQLQTANNLDIVSGLLDVAAITLAMLVVSRVTERITERGADPAGPPA